MPEEQPSEAEKDMFPETIIVSGSGDSNSPDDKASLGKDTVEEDANDTLSNEESESVVQRDDVSIEIMKTRMQLAGLLGHAEVARVVEELDQQLNDASSQVGGTEYAAVALGRTVAHRTATNHLVEHLLASDEPASIVTGDRIKIFNVGKGGVGSISAAYTTEHGLHMWKQLTLENATRTTNQRFRREAKIMKDLKGIGVPRFTHMDESGYGYGLRPRRSLAMLNSGFMTFDQMPVTQDREPPTAEHQAASAEGDVDFSISSDTSGFVEVSQAHSVTAPSSSSDLTQGQNENLPKYPRSFVNRIGAEIAKRFAYFHDQGYTHRDLKPGNVMITDDGEVEVIDFGFANALTEETLTESGDVFGTPYYMAPEQLQSAANAEGPADVWALGVMMYEMHTGILPFAGNNKIQIVTSITSKEPDFSRIASEEDRVLIKRMLKKDPDLRPSMTEVAQHCFNASIDLKEKFGEDFRAFERSPTSSHKISMPDPDKTTQVFDYVGLVTSRPSQVFDTSVLQQMKDGPLDSGIRDESVLQSIRTRFPDDSDSSDFPASTPPRAWHGSPVVRIGGVVVLSAVAILGTAWKMGAFDSRGIPNTTIPGQNDPPPKEKTPVEAAPPIAPDTRPGTKYDIVLKLNEEKTGAIEWEKGRIEVVNGHISRLEFGVAEDGKFTSATSIPFSHYYGSSQAEENEDFTLSTALVTNSDWIKIAHEAFGKTGFSTAQKSVYFAAASRGNIHYVWVPKIGGVVIDTESGDVRLVDEVRLSADKSLCDAFSPVRDMYFDTTSDLEGNPYPDHKSFNSRQANSVWPHMWKSGVLGCKPGE